MNRKLLGFVIVVAACALMYGIMFDFGTLTRRHLSGKEIRTVFAIAFTAIGFLLLFVVNKGGGSGGGPQPPRYS